jgi:hypothetical protein
MSGRSRWLATTVFFEAQLLGADKIPHCPVVDLEAALGEFGHKTAQGELSFPDPLRQKGVMLSSNWPLACDRPSGPAPRCPSPGSAEPN